jgi:tRNA threonylcarbamoyladenosine biosynthesis protein TsaE
MDIYRLESKEDFLATGFIDLLYGNDIAVIEWADKFPELLPEWSLKVEMEIISETSRKIYFSGFHPRTIELVEKLKDQNR